MVDTGFSSFDVMVDKANHVLKEIEHAYGWPKDRRKQSYAALRAVLHTARDRMTVEECVQFGAQLPTLLRGVYYDGWKPSEVPLKMSKEEFFTCVREDFPYAIEGDTERLARTVLKVLQQYVSSGEWDDVKAVFPGSLAAIFPQP